MSDEPIDASQDVADQRKADETALELVKQLITLASGVLALSATFIEKFTTDSLLLLVLLGVAWLLLLFAIYAGLQAMSAMVQALTRPEFTWAREHLKRYARTSKYCFALGISCFAVFAYFSLLASIGAKSQAREATKTVTQAVRP